MIYFILHIDLGGMTVNMNKTAVITDSNSGVTQAQAGEIGVYVIPMPFTMDGKHYLEDINMTQDEFYKRLAEGAEISTSQPAVSDVMELWDRLLATHNEIVHIPMSAGLSTACHTAGMLAKEYGGRVRVVDNKRISVTLRQSVMEALELAKAGMNALQIKGCLERAAYDSSIYIMVDTLKYLQKGGRVTPAGAALGSILNIKPVLQIQGEKLDAYAKVRGVTQARATMIKAIKKDFETRFAGCCGPSDMWLQMAYTHDREAALDFMREVKEALPGFEIHMDPLSLSVSCHIGPGALAVACSRKIKL